MHVVVVDWLSLKETVADDLDKQLRIEENHDCSRKLETLRQTELMTVVCSLLLTVVEEKIVNVVTAVMEKNNGNVVLVVVVVKEENDGNGWWWWWRKTIEMWRWWWRRKTIEFYGLQNYINAQHATIFSVYILLLRS